MKRWLAIWLVVLTYSVSVCVGFLETVCCSGDPAHASGEFAETLHLHSRVYVAVHSFFHSSSSAGQSVIVGRRCCLGQHAEEARVAPHTVSNQRVRAEILWTSFVFASFEPPDLRDGSAAYRLVSFCVFHDYNPSLESIRSVFLLI